MVDDRWAFKRDLAREIQALIRKADREGMTPAVRLNGTSDLLWLALWGAREFPEVQFYDYTKNPGVFKRELPINYNVTFSYDTGGNGKRDNWGACERALAAGFNVAVVFGVKNRKSSHNGRPLKNNPLPLNWRGYPVLDGDKTDLRFTDKPGHIVGLRAKGDAAKSGVLETLASPNEKHNPLQIAA